MNINLHKVTKIEIGKIVGYAVTNAQATFWARTIVIRDAEGNNVEIQLFTYESPDSLACEGQL